MPLYVPNIEENARFVAKDWWRQNKLSTFLGIPVIYRNSLLAVLALNGRESFQFDHEIQELLDYFVAQAALALHNAERYMTVSAARDVAEAATRAKIQFLATISHELRTPLNSIIGFSNILLKNKKAHLDDQEIAYMSRIANSGIHLLSLINNVLDISKIEAEQMDIDIRSISLKSLITDIIGHFESR